MMRYSNVVFYSYRRSMGKFVIKRADLDHKNHNISAEIFSLYADQRRPSGETAETADQLLQVEDERRFWAIVATQEPVCGIEVTDRFLCSELSCHCVLFALSHWITTTTTVLRPFFRYHPVEPVLEENFWTLWCKGRLTEADILTIRLGATPSGQTNAHLHHPPYFLQAVCPSRRPTNSVKALKANSINKRWMRSVGRFSVIALSASWWYGDGAGNTAEENSSVSDLIQMR